MTRRQGLAVAWLILDLLFLGLMALEGFVIGILRREPLMGPAFWAVNCFIANTAFLYCYWKAVQEYDSR